MTPLKVEAPPDPGSELRLRPRLSSALAVSSARCPGPGPPQPLTPPLGLPLLPSVPPLFLPGLSALHVPSAPQDIFSTQLCDHLPAPSHLPSGLLSPKTSSDSPRPGRDPILSTSPQRTPLFCLPGSPTACLLAHLPSLRTSDPKVLLSILVICPSPHYSLLYRAGAQ